MFRSWTKKIFKNIIYNNLFVFIFQKIANSDILLIQKYLHALPNGIDAIEIRFTKKKTANSWDKIIYQNLNMCFFFYKKLDVVGKYWNSFEIFLILAWNDKKLFSWLNGWKVKCLIGIGELKKKMCEKHEQIRLFLSFSFDFARQ